MLIQIRSHQNQQYIAFNIAVKCQLTFIKKTNQHWYFIIIFCSLYKFCNGWLLVDRATWI